MIAQDRSLCGMGTTLTAMLIAGTRIGPAAHRRLPRLPAARRRAHPDHPRPHAGPDVRRRGPHHPRAGRLRTRSGRSSCGRSRVTTTSTSTSRYATPSRATATCSAATACRRWSPTRPCSRPLQLPDPQQAVDRMIDLALRGGGPDNITCIVAEVLDEPADGRRRGHRRRRCRREYTPIALPRPDTPSSRASLMTAAAKPQREAVRSYAAAHATRKQAPTAAVAAVPRRRWSLSLAACRRRQGLPAPAVLRRRPQRSRWSSTAGSPTPCGVKLSTSRRSTGIHGHHAASRSGGTRSQDNITASSLRGAQAVVTELRANQLPPCAAGCRATRHRHPPASPQSRERGRRPRRRQHRLPPTRDAVGGPRR